jgi:hypothetical protein
VSTTLCEIEVAADHGGTEIVYAKVSGPLAIHRGIHFGADWVITHVPTGRVLEPKFGSERTALEAMVYLRDAGDWMRPFDELRADKTLKAAVEKVARYGMAGRSPARRRRSRRF